LVLKRALCAGYAESFAYLLEKAGIEAYVISGDSIDRRGESVPHAWNLVYIDRQPYYFDITWNDNGKNATYDYFGVTSKDILA
jgi:transglutaminase/protease-like cytokinesis protein 3